MFHHSGMFKTIYIVLFPQHSASFSVASGIGLLCLASNIMQYNEIMDKCNFHRQDSLISPIMELTNGVFPLKELE